MKPEIKILKILSHAFSPPVVAAETVVIFSSLSPNIALSAGLGILFLAVIPILPFLYFLGKRQTNINIISRRIRTVVLIMAIASYAASSAVFYYLDYHAMFAISLAYLFVDIAIMVNNLFWKISIHAAGIAGPTTALVYVFGTKFVFLYIFTAMVFYIRLKLKAHTLCQLVAGCAVAVVVTFLTYLFFY